MNVIQKSIIEQNAMAHKRNNDLLSRYLEAKRQGLLWHATVNLAKWGQSEKHRMQIWDQAKAEYGLSDPDPDPLQEEEKRLLEEIYQLKEKNRE